nr:FAD-binding protein [Moorella glycerini]
MLRTDIQLMGKTMAIDLLSNDDIVYGVTCAIGNEIINVHAKAVIMATGGLGRIYSETTNPKDITADGLAMAYRAGAQLTGIEFIQFYPYRLGYPKILDLNPAIFDDGAIFVNRDGKRFMEAFPRGEHENRDILAREMFKQKDVFLELKEMDTNSLVRYPELYRLIRRDSKQKLKMKVAAHFSMGGILADSIGRTTLQGLYACGECMGGLHGTNRLAGSALVECAVFGFRTGNAAAEYALKFSHKLPLKTPDRIDLPLLGLDNTQEIISSLRKTMWQYAGIIREAKGLKICKEKLSKLSDELSQIRPLYYRQWFELKNMLQIANLIVEAALLRKETRGSHYRIDFPDEELCVRKSIIERGKSIMFQE